MAQTGPSSSTASFTTPPTERFIRVWLFAVVAIIASATAVAYFASLHFANYAQMQPSEKILRGSLLLFAIVLVSGLANAITIMQTSRHRRGESTRVQSLLLGKNASVSETDERFRLMFHRNPLPAYVYDCASLRVLDANEAASEKYGYTLHEFPGLNVADIRQDANAAELEQELGGRHAGFNHAGVWLQRRKDGCLFSADATVVRFVCDGRDQELVVVNDVTERVAAEEALRESHERLRSLVDQAPFGICRSRYMAERFESVNPALCEMMGYSEEEALKLSLSTSCMPTTQTACNSMNCCAATGNFKGMSGVLEEGWKFDSTAGFGSLHQARRRESRPGGGVL